METETNSMGSVCEYCDRKASAVVHGITVCDYSGCAAEAERETAQPTPLSVLLARYQRQGETEK